MPPAINTFMRMREIINLIEDRGGLNPSNVGVYKGRKFWSGAFDTRDGHIIEVHSYEKAESADFHHSFYFNTNTINMMSDGEAQFFWIDRGKIQTEWRGEAANPKIIAAIRSQIDIVS